MFQDQFKMKFKILFMIYCVFGGVYCFTDDCFLSGSMNFCIISVLKSVFKIIHIVKIISTSLVSTWWLLSQPTNKFCILHFRIHLWGFLHRRFFYFGLISRRPTTTELQMWKWNLYNRRYVGSKHILLQHLTMLSEWYYKQHYLQSWKYEKTRWEMPK